MARQRRVPGLVDLGGPLAATPIIVAIDLALGVPLGLFGLGLTWGIATSVMAAVQLSVALRLKLIYDRAALRSFVLAPLFPLL